MSRHTRSRRHNVRCPLTQGQGRPFGVALRLVPRLESVAVAHVRARKISDDAVEIDVVLKPREPVGQPVRVIGASRPIEGETPP